MTDIEKIFSAFKGLKAGIIGDIMLDTYMIGKVERISPEAPVPVIALQHKEQRIGGAGNVALNCQALGAGAFILGMTGEDQDGDELLNLFKENKINTTYSIRSKNRVTTNKTRIISRSQQMMRIDSEVTEDISPAEQKELLHNLEIFLKKEKPDVVIFEDYNKGVLTEETINKAIHLCKTAGVVTAVDPKRKNFFAYQSVDIFKPNLKEVEEALNLIAPETDMGAMRNIHAALHGFLSHRISFITLSEKGVFYQSGKEAAILPSHIRQIADVSGAGDTVIAVATLVYAVTKNIYLMAEIANIAGGLVCEEVGTAAINRDRLLRECELLLS